LHTTSLFGLQPALMKAKIQRFLFSQKIKKFIPHQNGLTAASIRQEEYKQAEAILSRAPRTILFWFGLKKKLVSHACNGNY